jgi:hypothetical protein
MISLATLVNVYGVRNDYWPYEVAGDGVDTMGAWGSNPHAPTIFNADPLIASSTSSLKILKTPEVAIECPSGFVESS